MTPPRDPLTEQFIGSLLVRLSHSWMREDEALRGLYPKHAMVFIAQYDGYVERRKRWFRRGYWIRLKK